MIARGFAQRHETSAIGQQGHSGHSGRSGHSGHSGRRAGLVAGVCAAVFASMLSAGITPAAAAPAAAAPAAHAKAAPAQAALPAALAQAALPAAPAAKPPANGLKPNAPAPTVTVTGGTTGTIDKYVAASLSDLFTFYGGIFPATFQMPYLAPEQLVSYDSRKKGTVCGESTLEYENAFYSAECDMVAWDRGVMMPQMVDAVGVLGPVAIMAHEIGHDVQYQLGLPDDADALLAEQQADCYAGAYWRWAADGKSKYFSIDRADGLRQLLLGMVFIRDPYQTEEEQAELSPEDAADVHGTGFDRAYAAALGYTYGAARCNKIGDAEMAKRGQIQEGLFNANAYEPYNLSITVGTIKAIAATANQYFRATTKGYIAPKLVASATGRSKCGVATLVGPAVYCAATNTVTYQLAGLRKIGTPPSDEALNGDVSAFTLLVSRYALAARKAAKLPVTGAKAGLGALCYTGSWARWIRTPRSGYQVTPWDLDKAVVQVIESPLAGTDASGKSASIATTRVAALGYGVGYAYAACTKAYGK